jgi:hypothetical protein
VSCPCAASNTLEPVFADLYVGSAPAFPLTLTDETGAAVNLTGATLWMTCKTATTEFDGEAIFQKTTGAGISYPDAAAGLALVQLTTADTADLTAGKSYYFDLQLLLPGGELQIVMAGYFRARPRVTLAQ